MLDFAFKQKLVDRWSPTSDTMDFYHKTGKYSLLLTFTSLNFLSFSTSSNVVIAEQQFYVPDTAEFGRF